MIIDVCHRLRSNMYPIRIIPQARVFVVFLAVPANLF